MCFDTVGLVMWPVKIVPDMTYNVSSVTLGLYTTTYQGEMIVLRPLWDYDEKLSSAAFITLDCTLSDIGSFVC